MRDGNPNTRANVFQPPDLTKSRFSGQRANPWGFGTERLQGGALQPLTKINSIPGYGALSNHIQQRRPMPRRLLNL